MLEVGEPLTKVLAQDSGSAVGSGALDRPLVVYWFARNGRRSSHR